MLKECEPSAYFPADREAPRETSFVGIFDWDHPADLVVTSPGVAKIFSLSPERAARGLPVAEFLKRIHADDLPSFTAELERTLAVGGDFWAEYRVVLEDGTTKRVLGRGRWDKETGHFPGAIVLLDDGRPRREWGPRCHKLAPRELESLHWCSRGKTNWEIGQILGISERTVEHHISSAARKLQCSTRAQAVAQAIREQLID